jgi:multiple sugar transport system permease protein
MVGFRRTRAVDRAAQASLRDRARRNLAAYAFMLPYLVVMLLFGVGPGLYALLITFAKFVGGTAKYFAAGFANYSVAVNDFRFATVFGNIVKFLLVSVPFGVAAVVLLAVLLHMRPGRGAAILRTLYFLPGAVTGPALMLLAIFMLTPQLSPFTSLLSAVGLNTFNQVVGPNTLPVVFTVITFFSGAGLWVAIHYGALQGIPAEVIESATLDGASAWQKAWYIKIPLIKPYLVYQFILVFAANVQLFVEPQLLGSQMGPAANVPAQWSPNQLAYAFAFGMGNFGASAVLSLLMLFIGWIAAYLVIRATGFFDFQAERA